ncbi:triadin-like [Hylobates moloch]|uniref:triadin-like n=1 Tax=Hylobates moloch TaxID=81572 RepID=UPI002677116A|nr:triadin-like [Hylobates moloch]
MAAAFPKAGVTGLAEIRKEKSGKTSSVLKDKEPIKGKEEKVPASLKEKEPETKKDEKMSKAEQDIVKPEKTVSHGKPGKEVKPKPPQLQGKKEEKTRRSETRKDCFSW